MTVFAFLSHRNRPMQVGELFGVSALGSRTAVIHYRKYVPGFKQAWARVYGARDSIWEPALETRPSTMVLPLMAVDVEVSWHATGNKELDGLIRGYLRAHWGVGVEHVAYREFYAPERAPDDAPAEVRRMASHAQTLGVFEWTVGAAKRCMLAEGLVAKLRGVPSVTIDRPFAYPARKVEDVDYWDLQIGGVFDNEFIAEGRGELPRHEVEYWNPTLTSKWREAPVDVASKPWAETRPRA
jgi:hypothetical protein